MQQLQTRFVWASVRWWLWALIAFIAAYAINTVPCMVPGILPGAAAVCEPALPVAYVVWPVLTLIGCAMGGWRFYRDYYCGDIARDFYE